jgi:hypothetical protein
MLGVMSNRNHALPTKNTGYERANVNIVIRNKDASATFFRIVKQ